MIQTVIPGSQEMTCVHLGPMRNPINHGSYGYRILAAFTLKFEWSWITAIRGCGP